MIGKLRTKKDAGELRNFGVDVQVNEGVVWISGRVASKDQQTLVLEVARRIRGVKQVVNDISVSKGTPVKVASTPIVDAAPATVQPVQPVPPAPVGTAVPQAPAPLRKLPRSPKCPWHSLRRSR